MTPRATSSTWPLFDLVVRTPRLTLEYANDSHLQTLATFRDGRVLQVGEEPFDGDSSFYIAPPASTVYLEGAHW